MFNTCRRQINCSLGVTIFWQLTCNLAARLVESMRRNGNGMIDVLTSGESPLFKHRSHYISIKVARQHVHSYRNGQGPWLERSERAAALRTIITHRCGVLLGEFRFAQWQQKERHASLSAKFVTERALTIVQKPHDGVLRQYSGRCVHAFYRSYRLLYPLLVGRIAQSPLGVTGTILFLIACERKTNPHTN